MPPSATLPSGAYHLMLPLVSHMPSSRGEGSRGGRVILQEREVLSIRLGEGFVRLLSGGEQSYRLRGEGAKGEGGVMGGKAEEKGVG